MKHSESLRLRIDHARSCYADLSHSCVIRELEGPLRARSIPSEMRVEEIEEALELLSLAYLSVGLEGEARKTFSLLLAKNPFYRLIDPMVAPEWRSLVDALALKQWLHKETGAISSLIENKTLALLTEKQLEGQVAAWLQMKKGARFGRWIGARSRYWVSTQRVLDWGPLWGPSFRLVGGQRQLWGDDAHFWGDGNGFRAEIGLLFEPMFVRWGLGWTQHESLVRDPVSEFSSTLNIISGDLGVGGRLLWGEGSFEYGGGGGVELLYVGGVLEAFYPQLHALIGFDWPLWEEVLGVHFQLRLNGVFGAGFSAREAYVGSLSSFLGVGFYHRL